MRKIWMRVLLAVATLHTAASAQKLSEVIQSLDDRVRLTDQRSQLGKHYAAIASDGDPYSPVELHGVNWVYVGRNPTAAAIDALPIDQKIEVLQQALSSFRDSTTNFLNVSEGDLAATNGRLQHVRFYTHEDFPNLTVKSVGDYVPVLHSLAHEVLALRVLPWTFGGETTEAKWEVKNNEVLIEDPPGSDEYVVQQFDKDQPEDYDMETTFPDDDLTKGEPVKFGHEDSSGLNSMTEYVSLGGSFSEGETNGINLRDIHKYFEISYLSKIDSSATVPGLTGQTSGKVYILAKTSKTPISPSTVPEDWDRTQSASKVVGTGDGSVSLTPDVPDIKVDVTWNGEDHVKYVHVEGQETLSGPMLSRTIWAVMVPTFTRGVDVAVTKDSLEKAARMAAQSAHVDGSPLLNPAKDLLFGIDLGVGPQGKGGALLGLSALSYFPDGFELGYGYPVDSKRFDTVTALRIIGDANDYRVTYETDRGTWGSPPAGGPEFAMWGQSRIKQVVTRDLLINVTCSGRYMQIIDIYRRKDGSVPETPPGQVIPTGDAVLLRTLTLTHPGDEPAYDSAQDLTITDSLTASIHEIKMNEDDPWPGLESYGRRRTVEFITRNGASELFRSKTEGVFDSLYLIDVPGHPSKTETFLDGKSLGSASPLLIVNAKNVTDYQPINWNRIADGRTIRSEGGIVWEEGERTTRQTITDSEQPNGTIQLTRNKQDLITSMTRGDWSYEAAVDATGWKEVVKFKGKKISTTWTDILDEDRRVRVYTAPDGDVDSRTNSATDWSEVEYGKPDEDPAYLAGLPRITRSKGGYGSVFTWSEISGSGIHSQVDSGYLSSGSVTNGSRSVSETNQMGYVVKSMDYLLQGSATVQTAGSTAAPDGGTTATPWHQPLKYTDYTSGLDTKFEFDGEKQRISSVTDGFGVKTEIKDVDGLGRLQTYTWAGHNGTLNYNQSDLGVSESLTIPGRTLSSGWKTDGFGRLLTATSTAGTTTDFKVERTADKVTTTVNDGLTGAEQKANWRRKDGSFESVTSDLLAFGGQQGDMLSVENGLLKSKVRCKQQSSMFSTVWTDAWGRPRKMEDPSPTGGPQTTTWIYSDPGDAVSRVEMRKSSGQRFIDEVDLSGSSGIITRSGLDVNRNGHLGAGDRYRETVTSISSSDIETKTTVTEGMAGTREVLDTTVTPATGVSQSKLNQGEETLTTTPNYTTRKVTTHSSKGWDKTSDFNELGQLTKAHVSGAGVPTSEINPSWRDDGSLAGMDMSVGGRSAGATFGNDGLLTGATRNGTDIFGGHGISGNFETLTLDGVTLRSKLDGTEWSINGPGIVGESHSIARAGSGYADTTVPTAGQPTVSRYNAAGMKVGHDYAAGVNTQYGWYPGGMLAASSCARGGAVTYAYSNDGAADLIGRTFPVAASGSAFSYPAASEIYGHDLSGGINSVTDASGARAITTSNGHPYLTNYTAGPMAGYQVQASLDGNGRRTGVQVVRNGSPVHTVLYGMNGDSGEIASINLSGLTVGVGRDSNRLVTGFQWNGGPVQSWSRDATGRITSASSSVSTAPGFSYPAFDAKGRRTQCTTAGGTWVYSYDGAGQLVSAVHPTLGTFAYGFDGIGRRVSYDMGGHHYTAGNGGDPLNRFVQTGRPQSKTMHIGVADGAQVWVNGAAQTVSGGKASFPLASPGAAGGWVNWTVRGELAGAGESGANPDALAETTGQVWFPPASETFVHDVAGNRQSSARWDYGWDSRNRLRNARTKDWNTAPQGWELSFDYDSEGRRFKKTVKRYEKGVVKEDTVTWFVWDGWELLYERQETPTGTLLKERGYGWGPDLGGSPGAAGGAGGLVVMREKTGSTTTDYYPLYDGGGNVTGLAKPDGSLAATYAYGPFGEPITADGPVAAFNPMRFATKYYDAETGLYYYGQRYYDPSTGTWLSREPLGESESLNLYAYCHNDPVNKVDVRGLNPWASGKIETDADRDALGLITSWMSPEEAEAFQDYVKMVSDPSHTLTTTATLQNMRDEGYLAKWTTAKAARANERAYMAAFQAANKSPILSYSILPALGNATMAFIPRGNGPEQDQRGYGSLAIDTFRLNAGGIIMLANPGSAEFAKDYSGFINAYENTYSAGSRFGANALLFAAPFAPSEGVAKFSGSMGRRVWDYFRPALGELLEQQLARQGSILYVVPPGKSLGFSGGTGTYGNLAEELSGTGLQANHLNQNAAFKSIIPEEEGLAVAMRGNAFSEVGSPHFEFHADLEAFWAPYRKGGCLFGQLPTNEQYGRALKAALIRAGYAESEAIVLAEEAAAQRISFGLVPSLPVPRIPGRLPQRRP